MNSGYLVFSIYKKPIFKSSHNIPINITQLHIICKNGEILLHTFGDFNTFTKQKRVKQHFLEIARFIYCRKWFKICYNFLSQSPQKTYVVDIKLVL